MSGHSLPSALPSETPICYDMRCDASWPPDVVVPAFRRLNCKARTYIQGEGKYLNAACMDTTLLWAMEKAFRRAHRNCNSQGCKTAHAPRCLPPCARPHIAKWAFASWADT